MYGWVEDGFGVAESEGIDPEDSKGERKTGRGFTARGESRGKEDGVTSGGAGGDMIPPLNCCITGCES